MESLVRVIVVLEDAVRGDKAAVAAIKRALRHAGWRPARPKPRLEKLGLLAGEIERDRCEFLRSVKGVQCVEEDAERTPR